MKQTGIFYEIGASGQTLKHLLDSDWKAQMVKREQEGQPVFAPIDLCERWIGYFVEPLASRMAEMLDYGRNMTESLGNKDWENAHYIQCAVGGKTELRQAEVIEFLEGTPYHMATLASSSFYETWARAIMTYWVPTLTLDELFRSLGAYPDLLRLDIEGLEVETLESYSFDPKPQIIQIDHHEINKAACCDILENHGYTIVNSEWASDADYPDDSLDIYAEYQNTGIDTQPSTSVKTSATAVSHLGIASRHGSRCVLESKSAQDKGIKLA